MDQPTLTAQLGDTLVESARKGKYMNDDQTQNQTTQGNNQHRRTQEVSGSLFRIHQAPSKSES
jgi:hypothetical protein